MTLVFVILGILMVASVYLMRFHFASFLLYLSTKLEPRGNDLEILSSLRQSLVHERKKKIAGLEMILTSWEKGDEIQSRYDYFQELLHQLNDLVASERRNLMAITLDIFLWAKLHRILRRVEKVSQKKRERIDVNDLKENLAKFKKLTDQVVDDATERFYFSLNDAVRESLKIVRIEKSQYSDIKIEESLDAIGSKVRFSYSRFKDWQRLLTNLIRNAVEAVETKQSGGAGVAEGFSLRGGEERESLWVKVSTRESDGGQAGMPDPPRSSISVIIEDSGIGMDKATRSSFFKKGFTSGKEHGLGLGVTEESIQFVEQYGNWEIESQKGVGTKIAIYIDQEKAQKGELILPERKLFYRTRLALGLYFLLLVLIGLALLFAFDKYSRFWVDWNPTSARVENGKLLIVFNKIGDETWRRRFTREISVGSMRDPMTHIDIERQGVELVDINQDGKNEIFAEFLPSESETGYLLCLNYKGDWLWIFPLGKKDVYKMGSQIYAASFNLFFEDVDCDGQREVVLSANCRSWYPCQVAVLNQDGQKEGEYWHSGHVEVQFVKDIDKDGDMEIVCAGVNNHLGPSPVVLVLSGKNVKGQSPPYGSEVLPRAREEIYVKIPRLWERSNKIGRYPCAGIRYNGAQEGYEEYLLKVDDYEELRREYFIDQNLKLRQNLVFSPTFHDEWAKLRERGLIDFDITPEILQELMKLERWENGVKVR